MKALERAYLGLLCTMRLAANAGFSPTLHDLFRFEPLNEWLRPHLFSPGPARLIATLLEGCTAPSCAALLAQVPADGSQDALVAAEFFRALEADPPPVDVEHLRALRRRLEDAWRGARALAALRVHSQRWATEGVDAAGLERLSTALAALARTTRSAESPVVTIGTAVRRVFGQYERAFETPARDFVRDPDERSVPVPRVDPEVLASLADGLLEGSVHAVAVADGVARTRLLIGLIEQLTMQQRRPLLLLTEVRAHEELTSQMFAALAGIPHARLEAGIIDEADWPRLARVADRIFKAKVEIEDSGALQLDGVVEAMARLAADAGQVPVLVVDPHVGRSLDNLLMELNDLGPSLPGAVLMLAPIDPASGARDRPPALPGLGFGCGWVFTSHRARGQKQRSYDLFTIRRDGAKGQPVARGSDLVEADTARA